MKTKLIVILALLLPNLFLTNSYSQNSKFIGSISSGINSPIGETGVTNQGGYSISGKIGYKFNSHLVSGIDVDYNSFPNKNDKTINSGGSFVSQSFKVFFMFTNFSSKGKIFPYGLLAFGLNMKDSGPFNMDIGGGIGYRISKNVSFFLEPKFTGTFESYSNLMFTSVKMGVMLSP